MKKVLIVYANYYKEISSSLKSDAELILKKSKIKYKSIEVPGVFEIPSIISKYSNQYDGFIALGCVIKGETPHFDFICKSTFDGLINLSIMTKKPIGNGIITSLNKNQALERKGGDTSSVTKLKKGKGIEAARAVLTVFKNASR